MREAFVPNGLLNSYPLCEAKIKGTAVKEIFDNYLTDEKMLFRLLSLQLGVKLYPRESLVIFDEVQKYPRAREAVKELVANHTYFTNAIRCSQRRFKN